MPQLRVVDRSASQYLDMDEDEVPVRRGARPNVHSGDDYSLPGRNRRLAVFGKRAGVRKFNLRGED